MGEVHMEVQVEIHDLPEDLTVLHHGNKPSTYSTVMAWDQEFIVIFKRWHEHHHHKEPLAEFEFIFYSLGSPNPIPDGFGPGPVNNPIVVKPEDSPESLGFSNSVPLWVKRKHTHQEKDAETDA
ncbi:uncharacterized protein I206_104667 [Kwoniella pini CBS 10737]|uniref:Uncharacterized protein n=1 Tax=Kwoniella pini CBS 10737 TaxID=1296096 RepID=A0A1B9I7R1_9TREE|nr:uncharacterized protein I206_02205 [Kwoniella pini CBS 10737]OCF51491.1 hypothetical protein I206_02205 [Kwoniella pini CBS 10737]